MHVVGGATLGMVCAGQVGHFLFRSSANLWDLLLLATGAVLLLVFVHSIALVHDSLGKSQKGYFAMSSREALVLNLQTAAPVFPMSLSKVRTERRMAITPHGPAAVIQERGRASPGEIGEMCAVCISGWPASGEWATFHTVFEHTILLQN